MLNHSIYRNDIETVANLPYNWEKLKNKTIMISGATGMIGSFLIDVLMYRNQQFQDNCKIVALGRNPKKAEVRFQHHWKSSEFMFIVQDINHSLSEINISQLDFVFHAASNTHPVAYASDPVGTVVTNIIGTKNLLEFAVENKASRFVFASSVEIYGENRGDIDRFDEMYMGYIDCNTLRAGYPEGKRAGESLCQAYRKQYGIEVVIPRLARTYGPTMLESDTKAISQFIKNGINHDNIILKSEGNQLYSYTHVTDAVSGSLFTLLNGEDGEAYNIADEASDVTLKELAEAIAKLSGTKVIIDLPDEIEAAGFSKATKALLDPSKINRIGWHPLYSIKEGLRNTLTILKDKPALNG